MSHHFDKVLKEVAARHCRVLTDPSAKQRGWSRSLGATLSVREIDAGHCRRYSPRSFRVHEESLPSTG